MVSKGLIGVFIAVVSLLAAFRLNPNITTSPMKMKPPEDVDGTIIKINSIERLTFSVQVQKHKIHCWLYSPAQPLGGKSPPPVVVAAYGLGIQKDIAMIPFALHMAEEGIATILFDYRHWGVSEGLPRHVGNPDNELEDIKTLLQHIYTSKGLNGRVDYKRIALYGASFGGGLVLATASLLHKQNHFLKDNIKAVVAAVPFVSGKATQENAIKNRGIRETLWVVFAVLNDLVRSYFSSDSAVYIPLAKTENSDELSAMKVSEEEYRIWVSRTPIEGKKVDGAWENKLAARTLFYLSRFQPDELVVNYLKIPTLIIAGSEDTLCRIEPIRSLVDLHGKNNKKNKIILKEYNLRHFDFLSPKNHPILLDNSAAFYKKFL